MGRLGKLGGLWGALAALVLIAAPASLLAAGDEDMFVVGA